jgi:lipoprotein-releasing system permease protein
VGKLAQISAALGAALMVCAFGVLEGFRVEVRERIFSFGGHALVQKITTVRDQADWVSSRGKFYQQAKAGQVPGVRHVQGFVYKPALARATKQAEGLLLKGLDPRVDTAAFKMNLVAGCLPGQAKTDSNTLPLCLSEKLAQKLGMGLDSTTLLYFLQEPPKIRKGFVCGIYRTGLEEYDEAIALTTAGRLQQLAGVGDSLYNGFEVFATHYDALPQTLESIQGLLPFDQQVIPATELQVQIFDWLDVIGRNVQIMLVLICVVACFNTAGTLLIFLLEKMRAIGLLLALGATPGTMRRVFWLLGLRLAGVGILWGNVVGVLVCLVQQYTHLLPLDQENYYVDHVPIGWNFTNLLLMNMALLGSLAIALLVPAWRAGKISPVEAMKEM